MSPDGSSTPTPEEKLLGLIRKKTDAGVGTATQRVGARGAGAVGTTISGVQAGAAGVAGAPWAKGVAIFLGIVLAVEIVLVVVEMRRPVPGIEIASAGPQPLEAVIVVDEVLEAMPVVADQVSHELFPPPIIARPEPKAPEGPSETVTSLSARLSLMGIVAGDSAQAIVQDSKTGKTYFVSKGQSVVEGAVLKEIHENHVVLDLQGERIELTL